MKNKILSLMLFAVIIFSGCASEPEAVIKDRQSMVVFDVFDTIVSVVTYQDEEDFEKMKDTIESEYIRYNQLYDIYNDYEGINNIKTINDNAGIEPVKVSEEIIDLLMFSKEWHYKTNGNFNIAMGTMLSIWSDVREEATLYGNTTIPSFESLNEVATLSDIEHIVIDEENSTVFITDANTQIDVGAVAKGYATEQIALLLEETYDNFAISAGGNVRIYGQPLDGERNRWAIGVQNPAVDENFVAVGGNVDTAYINGSSSVVCSGGYIRYFVQDGVRYHHLIDLETLYPADIYQGVSIIYKDSGVADVLSTASFLMQPQEAEELINSIEGASAQLIAMDGTVYNLGDIEKYLASEGIEATTK